jgi:transcriptional regulator with XRE-family HTH domain
VAIKNPPPMAPDLPPLSQVLRDLLDERDLSVIAAARLLARRTRNMNKDSWEGTLRRILNGSQKTVNRTTRRGLARVLEVPESTFVRRRPGSTEILKTRLAELEQRNADLEAGRAELEAELRRLRGDSPPDPA